MRLLWAFLLLGAPAAQAEPAAPDLQGVPPVEDRAQALWQQGSDSMEAGRYEAAVSAFEMALSLSPTFHDALYSLGVAARKSGDLKKAVLSFQELLRHSPQLVDAWYQMGLSFAQQGEYGKAADAYRMGLSYNAGCGVCRCALALASRERGRKEENFREARACVDLLPAYGGGWNLLGIAEMDKGNFDGAASAFQKAVELSPDYANAWYNLGSARRGLNQLAASEEAYFRSCGLDPRADNFNALGELRLRRGNLFGAEEAFLAALKADPQAAEPHWGLARMYRRKGQGRKADREEALYRRAAGAAQGDADYHVSEPGESLRKADLQALMEAWEDSHAAKNSHP